MSANTPTSRDDLSPEAVFFQAFHGMGRLGPGSESSTLRAVEMVGRRDEPLRILDVGCGNGVQTLLLTEAWPRATVTAVDNYQPFLETLMQEATRRGCADRLTTVCSSMDALDFPDGSFDLIWSEGAIYNIGFERGIREWKRLLAPGGALACSEACWLVDAASPDVAAFWHAEYPQIAPVAVQLKQIEAAGYRRHDHFILPAADWHAYYDPLQTNITRMRAEYPAHSPARDVLDTLQHEINLFRAHETEYSYAFYVMWV